MGQQTLNSPLQTEQVEMGRRAFQTAEKGEGMISTGGPSVNHTATVLRLVSYVSPENPSPSSLLRAATFPLSATPASREIYLALGLL